MSTQLAQDQTRRRSRASFRLARDFILLGLARREARPERIRQATMSAAKRIRLAPVSSEVKLAMTGELATSTYRLLDTRLRSRTTERIKLCVYSEVDWDRQRQAYQSWFDGDELAQPAGTSTSAGTGSTKPRSRFSEASLRAAQLGASILGWVVGGSFLASVCCCLFGDR